MRSRTVLLKSQGLTSKEIGLQTDMSHISVNSWVKRFETEGILGLETRSGRRRKPIMDCSDEEAARNNRYEGFGSSESMTADKVADSLDCLFPH